MSSDNCNGQLQGEEGEGKNSPESPKSSAPVSSSSVQVSRVVLSDAQLEAVTLDELRTQWKKQDTYINYLENLNESHQGELGSLREAEEKLKQQLNDSALKERILLRRLAAKDQSMQEYAGQLSEMKNGQAPTMTALRNALLDPAVNILVQKLRQELAETRRKLEDTQNELAACEFTPHGNTGMRLIAKCRLLFKENKELGQMISSGRLAKLEGDLALQKSFSEEVKKSQSEFDELLQLLDEDVEGMQSTIYYLQQELKKSKELVEKLEKEVEMCKHKTMNLGSPIQASNSSLNGSTIHHNGKWCQSSDVKSEPSCSPSKTSDSYSQQLDEAVRTRASTDEDSVVNNNIDDQRKRTTCENSEDKQTVKRPKLESHHYNEDDVVINGDSPGE